MTETRATSGKGLAALFCSMLLLLQPALASPDASVTAPTGTGNSQPDKATAASGSSNTAPQSIAVARLTGNADRNGQPLLNGSIVSSGDAITIHSDSALLLASTAQERLWLGPNTSATLTKTGENLAVALERGTLGFRSFGHIQFTFVKHDGVAIKSSPDRLVLGQLSFTNHEAQVRLQAGSLEVAQGSHSTLLQPSNSAALSATSGQPLHQEPNSTGQPNPSQTSGLGSIKGNVVDSQSFVIANAQIELKDSAGKIYKTTSSIEGNFQFDNVPPGTYTLHVSHPKYHSYDLPDVVVRAGNESNLFVQLGGGGAAGKSSNALLIGLVVAGGAAAGIGIALGTRGSKSTTSPSQ